MRRGVIVLALVGVASAGQQPPLPVGVQFDVISIKLNKSDSHNQSLSERPDGAFRVSNVTVIWLIARAYGVETEGLPDWAKTERYDVSATSTLARATVEDRATMMRAMLADRFQLTVHVEMRDEPAYDLVLARRDARLGPGLTPIDVDCTSRIAADAATSLPARDRPDPKAPPPPCTLRMVNDRLEGDTTMARLAASPLFRGGLGRPVVDKTGLTGYFHVSMTFDPIALRRGPDTTRRLDAAPTIFTAVEQDLGLKLQPSHATVNKLVIDHIERPTPN